MDAEVWSSHEEVVARAADAGIPATLIVLGVMPKDGVGGLVELAAQLGAIAVSFFPADLEPHVVRTCRERGMPFMCGTPNDPPTWRYLAASEARAIITDDPLRCAAALAAPGHRRGRIAGMS